MRVQDIMTREVSSCHPWTNLSEAAMKMWNHDCGMIPVLSDQGIVTGVITDRDICMSVATQHRRAEEISVGEVTNGSLSLCHPEDDVIAAIKTMAENRVRRLPVTDHEGHLVGVISLSDLVTAARSTRSPSYSSIIDTLKTIIAHPDVPSKIPVLQQLSGRKAVVGGAERQKGKLWKAMTGLSS